MKQNPLTQNNKNKLKTDFVNIYKKSNYVYICCLFDELYLSLFTNCIAKSVIALLYVYTKL